MPTTTENLIKVINPATGEQITEIKASSELEVKEKVQKARIEKRINYLSKISLQAQLK